MPRDRTASLVPKPDGTFKARITVDLPNGKVDRPWVHFETKDRKLAQKLLDREVEKGSSGQAPKRGQVFNANAVTVQDFVTAHKSDLSESDGVYLTVHFVPAFKLRTLETITTEEVERLLATALDQRAKAAAQRRKETSTKLISHGSRLKLLGAIGRIMTLAKKLGVIKTNPTAEAELPVLRGKQREVTKLRAMLEDVELNALLACPEFLDSDVNEEKGTSEKKVRKIASGGRLELKMMCLVARCEGGMRTGDVTAWDWSLIDTSKFASCIVPREKGADPQRMVIPDILRGPLKAWWTQAGEPKTGPVFPVRRGRRAGENRVKNGTTFAKRLRRDVARALTWAGMELRQELFEETPLTLPLDFHSFRRNYNTALADADVTVQKAMALAGHSDPKTHMKYVRLANARKAVPEAALPKLDGVEIGAPANRPGIVSSGTIQDPDPRFPARYTRFERVTFAFGGQRSIQLS